MLKNIQLYLIAPKKTHNVKLKNLLGFFLKEGPLSDLVCA